MEMMSIQPVIDHWNNPALYAPVFQAALLFSCFSFLLHALLEYVSESTQKLIYWPSLFAIGYAAGMLALPLGWFSLGALLLIPISLGIFDAAPIDGMSSEELELAQANMQSRIELEQFRMRLKAGLLTPQDFARLRTAYKNQGLMDDEIEDLLDVLQWQNQKRSKKGG